VGVGATGMAGDLQRVCVVSSYFAWGGQIHLTPPARHGPPTGPHTSTEYVKKNLKNQKCDGPCDWRTYAGKSGSVRLIV